MPIWGGDQTVKAQAVDVLPQASCRQEDGATGAARTARRGKPPDWRATSGSTCRYAPWPLARAASGAARQQNVR